MDKKSPLYFIERCSIVAFIVLLFLLALVLQTYVASQLSLWGDELDSIFPAFLSMDGPNSMWSHITRYYAYPPGESFFLRAYYQSQVLSWLRPFSEEIFWRIPTIAAYCSASLFAGLGAWRWTRSLWLGFFTLCFTLVSPGAFIFATEVRYYIWLLLFMTIAIWQFLIWIENPTLLRALKLSIVLSIGVFFHVLMLPVAILFLLFTWSWILLKSLERKNSIKEHFPLLLSGTLPCLVYIFEVYIAHWVYIPPTEPDIFIVDLFNMGNLRQIVFLTLWNLPLKHVFGSSIFQICFLIAFFSTWAIHCWQKNTQRCLQGFFLIILAFGVPAALLVSSGLRKYPLAERHFIFEIPLLIASCIYIIKSINGWLAAIGNSSFILNSSFWRTLALAAAFFVFTASWAELSFLGREHSKSSPIKINYGLVHWRRFYLQLPQRKPLVIVGTQPDNRNPNTDIGTYNAGMFTWYTHELNPVYYSSKGTFDSSGREAANLRNQIRLHPEHYDFLIADEPARIQPLFPELPWNRWSCQKFGSLDNLSFCRL